MKWKVAVAIAAATFGQKNQEKINEISIFLRLNTI